MINPYVLWEAQAWASGRGDPNWHAASGPVTCADTDYKIAYNFYDIVNTGTTIQDSEWVNPNNEWNDDDGWVSLSTRVCPRPIWPESTR